MKTYGADQGCERDTDDFRVDGALAEEVIRESGNGVLIADDLLSEIDGSDTKDAVSIAEAYARVGDTNRLLGDGNVVTEANGGEVLSAIDGAGTVDHGESVTSAGSSTRLERLTGLCKVM